MNIVSVCSKFRSLGRGENAECMIRYVEKLKKAECGANHLKVQKEYDNMNWDYLKYPEKRAEVLEGYWGATKETLDTKYFPKHPLFKTLKTVADKNYRKKHAILSVKNNDFVDSFKFTLLKSKPTGFMKVNFKDGSSNVVGKYVFGHNIEKFIDETVLPMIHKYVPESVNYPDKIIKDIFCKPQ